MPSLPNPSPAFLDPGPPPRTPWDRHLRETLSRMSPWPLLYGLGTRPVLLAPIAFVMAVLVFDAGAAYGAPDQFFHESLAQQALNGLIVSLLFGLITTVAYLIDAKERWVESVAERSVERGLGIDRKWRWYLDCSWVPLTVGFLALLAWRGHWAFAAGMALPVAVYYPVRFRRWRRAELPSSEPADKPGLFDPSAGGWGVIDHLYDTAPHGLIFAAGAGLCVVFMSRGWLAAVCFVLSLWAAAHGAVLYQSVSRRIRRTEDCRFHGRVRNVFGACFLLYQLLFAVYCLDCGGQVITWVASPAILTCLLVAQLIAVHGFFRYHLRESYVLIVLGLLLLAAIFGTPAQFKHHLPGLNYDDVVQLDEADFEGGFATLLKATADLQEAGDDRDLLDWVMAKYHRMALLLRSRELRWRGRRDLAAHPRPDDPDLASVPAATEVAAALEAGRFADAYAAYNRLRAAFDDLSMRLEEFEIDGLGAWKAQAAAGGEKPKLVIVAVSGGANRAALWTTHVLDHLEQRLDRERVAFPRHVRLVTGASGGMVGASYWVATLDEKQRRHVVGDHDAFVAKVGRECLTPVVHHAIFLDLPTTAFRNRFPSDRGTALERAWSVNLDGALDRPIRSLARDEAEGWRPSLVFSPMLLEDGRRVLISNLSLAFLTESGGTSLSNPESRESRKKGLQRPTAKPTCHDTNQELPAPPTPRRDRYSLSAVEFFQLFPQADQFRLSTAVRMSASFPYVSPAADLPTEPRRRVVDAGYYDNYGVDVAASWLYQYRGWLAENTSGVVLIQVRDAMSERRRLYAEPVSLPLEGLTGPLVGLGSARSASMSFRNDELVQILSDHFNRHGKPMFTTVVFEAPGDVAMSWYLTRGELARMRTGFAEGNEEAVTNRAGIERLVRWWKRDHSR
ncbi:MAG: patatin-like phospholipase family protein [Gemmataceae bacterium]